MSQPYANPDGAIAYLSARIDLLAEEQARTYKILNGNGQPGVIERLISSLSSIDQLFKAVEARDEQVRLLSETKIDQILCKIGANSEDIKRLEEMIKAQDVSAERQNMIFSNHCADDDVHSYKMLLTKQSLAIIFLVLLLIDGLTRYAAVPIIKTILDSLGINIF